MSQGPIIQPRDVGNASTSQARTSRCAHASAAHRSGATWPHGSALGAPVVPEEKRMLLTASASHSTAENVSALPPAAA